MWNGRSVCVVLPTYNERDSIAGVIRGFEELGIADEIVVVNNNAAPGTSEEVATTCAREVFEPRQGYGAAIRRGLRETGAELVCVCEPDGTFDPGDLLKLLPYTAECDLVLGSRTVSQFIWDGANMGRFLRWGNWAVAKVIEVLFNTASLSDVGCTFRVVTRERVDQLIPRLVLDDSAFGLEMVMAAIRQGVPIVQVPVNYRPRVGESSVTGELRASASLGVEMLTMVARMRVGLWPWRRPPGASAGARSGADAG
jgi:glycosyltransferase involved in cell wall biosynthesis